ncbi:MULTISPECIES: DUF4400 domain-containing protein [unclassified Hydrogenophaga]|jgi:hypothetical protein|uniref:DUF4400 domain-containing protein n=1 Tax=unclassified Hydrogenophaga TaxID=2610897 RepID=UPI00131F6100|nr:MULTISPECIES: DUF4400 domain-containing protein [unclassified Hydrogenophaga]MDP3350478.1 DUF4400 domain-containing protein [Hydrogenophaga sp.]QHE78586.1 DUF4400 domain-containing protein [Hydrogenophaga sp. PBL-H3]QHE83011.1 DUF4400 domain-containing protein [Hydrogenophaga sp. PBL-H3]
MKNSQHLGFWFFLAMLGFLIAPMLRTGDSMERFVTAEIAQTRAAMGERVGNGVVSFANGLFENTPLKGVMVAANKASLTDKERQLSIKVAGVGGAVMADLFNSYMSGLVLQSYVVAMRLAIVMIWLVFLLPFFVAAVYDGLMQRSVKMAEFGTMRPATFTLAGMIVIPIVAMPVVYLVMPFTMSPLLAPVWAACVALPLSVLISNSQPIFGR